MVVYMDPLGKVIARCGGQFSKNARPPDSSVEDQAACNSTVLK